MAFVCFLPLKNCNKIAISEICCTYALLNFTLPETVLSECFPESELLQVMLGLDYVEGGRQGQIDCSCETPSKSHSSYNEGGQSCVCAQAFI